MLRINVPLVAAALAIALAGCGSSSNDKKSSTSTTGTSSVKIPTPPIVGTNPKLPKRKGGSGHGNTVTGFPPATVPKAPPKPAASATDRGFMRALNRRCVAVRRGVVGMTVPKTVAQARAYSREMLPPARRTVAILRASRPTAGTQASVSALAASYTRIVPLFEQLAATHGASNAQLRRAVAQLRPALAKAAGQAVAGGFASCAPTSAARPK